MPALLRRRLYPRAFAIALWAGPVGTGCGDDGGGQGEGSSGTTTSGSTTTPADTGTGPTTTSPTGTGSTSTSSEGNTTNATPVDSTDSTSSDGSSSDGSSSSDDGSTGEPAEVPFYATYLGENDLHDQLRSTALDAEGNLYFVGGAYSPGLACDGVHAGNMDVIVGKVDAGGALAWCRYIGGTGYDRFYDLEVNSDGSQIVIAGRASTGFPVTGGAWDTTFAGGQSACGGPYGTQDGGVCAIDANDGSVAWCTYTGFAGGCDFIRTIALDANDDVILGTGYVGAVTDPQYAGVFVNPAPGGQGGIVGRLSADGGTLLWYRYVGGPGTSAVEGMVAVDSVGIYYAPAWSNDVGHTILDGFDATHNGGTDIYLARLSLDGAVLEYATYAGGSGGEDSGMHAVMPSETPGVVFVKVGTSSPNFPTSPGAISTTRSGPSDCGVIKVDTTAGGAASFVAGTYLGGSGDDFCEGAAWAPGIGLALSGTTDSDDLPVVVDAWQPARAGGDDGWIAIVSPDLDSIVYASYLGGTDIDAARAIDAAAGVIATVGLSHSNDLPVSPDAFQPAFSGGGQPDGIVVRIPW
jgi:hypothetical protein